MNKIILTAAVINLITAFIHTIGGHAYVIDPFVQAEVPVLIMAILHACWHMVTVTVFLSSFALLAVGLRPQTRAGVTVARNLGILYIVFGLVFILVGWGYHLFLFQVLLLMPIGLLCLWGAGAMGRTVTVRPQPLSASPDGQG